MAFKLAEAFVALTVKNDKLKGGMDKAKGIIGNALASLRNLFGRLLGGGAALGGIFGVGFAVKFASEAEDVMDKFRAVFQNTTEESDRFAKQLAKDVGRGVTEVRAAMAEFQDTFVPLGFARDEAAELSKQMAALAIDLQSFNPSVRTVEESQRLLTSGLVGNHEALRRFGVVITQTSLKQELLNMGIKKGVLGATELQKVQARLNLVMRGTKDAQGDAVRTGQQFANRMRAMRSAARGLMTTLGFALLPALGRLANMLTVAFNNMNDLAQSVLPTLRLGLDNAAAAFTGFANSVFSDFWKINVAMSATDTSFGDFFLDFTEMLRVTGENFTTFGKLIWSGMKIGALAVRDFFGHMITVAMDTISRLATIIGTGFKMIWDKVMAGDFESLLDPSRFLGEFQAKMLETLAKPLELEASDDLKNELLNFKILLTTLAIQKAILEGKRKEALELMKRFPTDAKTTVEGSIEVKPQFFKFDEFSKRLQLQLIENEKAGHESKVLGFMAEEAKDHKTEIEILREISAKIAVGVMLGSAGT